MCTPPNTCFLQFLGSTRVHSYPNDIPIGSVVLHGSRSWPTDWQTHRSTSANSLTVLARSLLSALVHPVSMHQLFGIPVWNSLDNTLRDSLTFLAFKRHLKTHLFHSAFNIEFLKCTQILVWLRRYINCLLTYLLSYLVTYFSRHVRECAVILCDRNMAYLRLRIDPVSSRPCSCLSYSVFVHLFVVWVK